MRRRTFSSTEKPIRLASPYVATPASSGNSAMEGDIESLRWSGLLRTLRRRGIDIARNWVGEARPLVGRRLANHAATSRETNLSAALESVTRVHSHGLPLVVREPHVEPIALEILLRFVERLSSKPH